MPRRTPLGNLVGADRIATRKRRRGDSVDEDVAGIQHCVRVLVVDDSAMMRDGVKQIASRLGCSVVGEAPDGASGLELAAALGPELVVLDLEMPRMDGLATLAALKELRPTTVVVMFSSDATSRERAITLGVDGWCDKSEGFAAPLATGLDVLRRRGNGGPEDDEILDRR